MPQRRRAVEDAATASETSARGRVGGRAGRCRQRCAKQTEDFRIEHAGQAGCGRRGRRPRSSEPERLRARSQYRQAGSGTPTERERAEAEFRGGDGGSAAPETAAEAEDKLRAALAIDPLLDKARQALLGLYIERGRREDAEQLLEDRLRMDRRPAGFALALARLQLARGANGEALATLQRSLPNGEASADYQAMLANALGRLGQHKQAAERFEMAARLAPRNPVWLMGLGVELRADNRSSEARVAFQRARELGGLNPQLASFVDQQLTRAEVRGAVAVAAVSA